MYSSLVGMYLCTPAYIYKKKTRCTSYRRAVKSKCICTCELFTSVNHCRCLDKKPCETFIHLKCNEFVDKILLQFKVGIETIPHYKYHVAMLVLLLLVLLFEH